MRSPRFLFSVLIPFALGACATAQTEIPANPLAGSGLVNAVKGESPPGLAGPFVRHALKNLESGDYVAAQKGFNHALKFNPTNAHLHFLNGLTYHLRAAAGDDSQLPFAGIGYRLALQYDPGNYWAAFQLGHIKFGEQNYREAQEAFAYALLFDPDNPLILKALGVASYYAQDLRSALSALRKAETLAPANAGIMYDLGLINAALGRFDRARGYQTLYGLSKPAGANRGAARLAARITDWKRFHERGDGIILAQSATDILGTEETTPGVSPPASGDSAATDSGQASSKFPTRMTLVDVIIIRSEERRATDKGVNLLSGLSATLGGTTFTFTDTRTVNFAAANTRTTSFTYSPTLSLAATYSLNIFNDNNDHNEVLARPSLIALDGMKSEFFTGAVLHVELTGAAGSLGSVQEVPIGIKLEVTPRFLDDSTVQLSVNAARAFIEGRSAQIGFNNFTQITKTTVTANATMKFGDTIIISGLSERETERLDDGVPILRDIPGVQYLFSHQDTLDMTKSVVILMTPRKPRYAHEDGSPKVDRSAPPDSGTEQPNLKELTSRPDWFKPAPNLDAVFQHLKDGRMFKEFRSGDVRLETWAEPYGLKQRILRAIEFLYY